VVGATSKNRSRDNKGRFVRTRKVWSLDNFNDGYIGPKGRFMIYLPSHSRANSEGYVLREIAAYEVYNKTIVPKNMQVHHKDENRLNDTKDNLQLVTGSEHQKIHARLNGERFMKTCKNSKCRKPFETTRWRKSIFCSRYCARHRPQSLAARMKKSEAAKIAWATIRRHKQ